MMLDTNACILCQKIALVDSDLKFGTCVSYFVHWLIAVAALRLAIKAKE